MIKFDKSLYTKNTVINHKNSSNHSPVAGINEKTTNLIDDFSDIFGGGATVTKTAVKVGDELGDIFSSMGNIDLTMANNKNVTNNIPQENIMTSQPNQSNLLSSLDAVNFNINF
jgi:hypothetical protein